MPADSISNHGDPNGKLFGLTGEINYNDEGDLYIKTGSQSDTLNVGWHKIMMPSHTPTISITPTRTPTRTPIVTRQISPVSSVTPTPTPTPTPTNSGYPEYTRTATPTITRTPTNTPTITPTITQTPSNYTTPTPTPTNTPTNTNTPTITPSKNTYTLSISKVGNGTTWPYGIGNISIPYGTSVSIDADPDPNNNYTSFVVSGITGAISSSTNYSDGIYGTCDFIMPQNDCTLTASFSLQTKLLTMNVNGAGTVNPSSGTYTYGTNVSIKATASLNNVFSTWTFGGTSNPSDGSTATSGSNIYMTDNRTATATFVPLKVVYANVNSVGYWSVNYKNISGNVVTLSGNTTPAFYNSQIAVSCGIEVYSGGGLLNTGCSS
jgi:hypothetical protein